MTTYGDDCKIAPGIIQGDVYTFLTESKTALFVQEPTEQKPGRVALFFLLASIAVGLGAYLDGKIYMVILPCVVVLFFAAVSLIKTLRENKPAEWKLLLGSGESPVVIYSDADAATFAAKRNEIEQVLLGRLTTKEK